MKYSVNDAAQIGITDDIFVDSFAGGGGASTGIELALGHPIDIAINHDEGAILMHQANHPFTEHYREDIFAIDPVKACRGRHVRLAWFSPDCRHFSKAKGGALVDRHIRGLAWIVLRWAGTARPDVIMLENVPEFVTWGPVRRGKPIKSRSGETYRKWYAQLSALGYEIQTKVICMADIGVPTIRKRFVLVARCDGKPIRFPERTHAPRDSEEVRTGKLMPWRSAAEILDWSIPCYSIFESKEEIREKYGAKVVRPLAEATMKRIIRGLDKFVIKSGKPFIVQRTSSAPYLIQYHSERSERVRGQSVADPIMTVDASNRYGLAAAFLSEYYGNAADGIDIGEPMRTITTKDREGMTAAYLTEYYSGIHVTDARDPMPTVTTRDRSFLTAVHIAHFKGNDKGQGARDPLMSITSRDGQFAAIETTIIREDSTRDRGHWKEIRGLLNLYCGYSLAEDDILLLIIGGSPYYISDIGLRMLTPRELFNAMGFPRDYIIDRDADGNELKRETQVARCGNAVCPALAEAMVRANLPECPVRRFDGMDELRHYMSS